MSLTWKIDQSHQTEEKWGPEDRWLLLFLSDTSFHIHFVFLTKKQSPLVEYEWNRTLLVGQFEISKSNEAFELLCKDWIHRSLFFPATWAAQLLLSQCLPTWQSFKKGSHFWVGHFLSIGFVYFIKTPFMAALSCGCVHGFGGNGLYKAAFERIWLELKLAWRFHLVWTRQMSLFLANIISGKQGSYRVLRMINGCPSKN